MHFEASYSYKPQQGISVGFKRFQSVSRDFSDKIFAYLRAVKEEKKSLLSHSRNEIKKLEQPRKLKKTQRAKSTKRD